MVRNGSDILVFGTGSFAARILFDLAATAQSSVTVRIAGRNAERLAWLRTAANARAAMFGRPARFATSIVDLDGPAAAAEIIAGCRPSAVVQAASLQTASVIASSGNAWTRLAAEGGLSATAVFQSVLTARVARAVKEVAPQSHLINCCFADVVNPLIAAMGLPVTCGIGNVAILATAFAGHLGSGRTGESVKVLAHYQNIAPWRRAPDTRVEPPARVWLGGAETDDVYTRFRDVRLTPEPVIDISGASGVPLMLALAGRHDWLGHVPGPGGLPGGYPVALRQGRLDLDLPAGLSREDAIAWNAQYEAANGLVIEDGGRARYTGALHERLRAASPELAVGFNVSDLEEVHKEMQSLRAHLQQQAA